MPGLPDQVFSVRFGTVRYRLKTPSRRVGEVLSTLAEGLSVGAAARVFGHGEFTIRRWLTRAGLHAASLHERIFQNLKLLHVQLDEPCTKTRQDTDALRVWFGVDARTKFIAVLKVGPRTQPRAHAVVHALVKVLAPDWLPVFTSDGMKLYFYALTAHFGGWVETLGRRTRQWQVHAQPLYGQVVKHYHRRRLVRVERRALMGSHDQLTGTLRASRKSGTIQTAYVERLNLTVRQAVAALSRRTWGAAQASAELMFHTTVEANAQRIFSSPGSPYHPLYEQCQKVTAGMRQQEPGPEVVSRVVQQAIASPRPKTRYVAGLPFSGRLVLHLGGAVWDLVVRRLFKIAPTQ